MDEADLQRIVEDLIKKADLRELRRLAAKYGVHVYGPEHNT